MNIFKAFAQIGPLVDNTPNVVAPIGELASMSRTFVRRQPTEHVAAASPNETLVGFSYRINDVLSDVEDATAASCLLAMNWIYATARTGKFDQTKDSFQQAFILNFGDTFDLIASGVMIPFGNFYCPEYINICPKGMSISVNWRIWFSDLSFYNQYDEFEILVVPPIIPLDQFFGDYDEVTALIAAIKQSDTFAKISTARDIYPETVLRNDVFTWQNKDDHTLQADTNWVTVIYGAAGDNLDNVKEAIRDYILDNSDHTRDEWAEIFPDLFTSTEFIFTPMWTDLARPNGNRERGIYRAITGIQHAMTLCHLTCQGVKYTNAHIDTVLEVVPTTFRSVMCSVVGGPENRDGKDMFSEVMPDYINVPTTHPDFMSMSTITRNFVLLLNEMIMNAEELTVDSGVPHGFNRTVRNGIVYISTSYEKFEYLIVTKASVEAAEA